MAKPNPLFRENPLRAVYIDLEIDLPVVRQVTKEFLKLRAEGDEPVTVIIDSPGGRIDCADNLSRLFASTSQSGKKLRVITVVHNLAASAAAQMLALGDYAIAHPGSIIHFHGTRISGSDVTREFAAEIADDLERANEARALRLARRCFGRIILSYSSLKEGFATKIKASESTDSPITSEIDCYCMLISDRICQRNRHVVMQAWKELQATRELFDRVVKKLPDAAGIPPEQLEAETLKIILEHKLETMKSKDWRLSKGGLKETMNDYVRLWDYISGDHTKDIEKWIKQWGPALLSNEEFAEFNKFQATKSLPEKWIESRVTGSIEQLWYYAVCLARCLQRDENPLTSVDAYWLGLVDEVVGLNLANLRTLLEEQDVSPSA